MEEKPEIEIIVARYSEDLSWILQIPAHIHCTVYNKGDLNIPMDICSSLHILSFSLGVFNYAFAKGPSHQRWRWDSHFFLSIP
jgi:hypothetical protein